MTTSYHVSQLSASLMSWVGSLPTNNKYMKVMRMGITEILGRIWLFSASKIKSSTHLRHQLIILAHNCHIRFTLHWSKLYNMELHYHSSIKIVFSLHSLNFTFRNTLYRRVHWGPEVHGVHHGPADPNYFCDRLPESTKLYHSLVKTEDVSIFDHQYFSVKSQCYLCIFF